MAEALPNRQSLRNRPPSNPRSLAAHRAGTNDSGAYRAERPDFDRDYLHRQELLTNEAQENAEAEDNFLSLVSDDKSTATPDRLDPESIALREENHQLRQTIAELNQLLEQADPAGNKGWAEREKEYDALLEEKSEVIRELHQRAQDLQEAVGKQGKPLPNEAEMQSIFDELERDRAQLDAERRQLEEERGQLRDDEEGLMKQMREMEMSMSKDRAELARQKNELQRLHSDIRHELEAAARDPGLRDRLVSLQRRHQDISNRKGGAPAADSRSPQSTQVSAVEPESQPKKKESGLFRRWFGAG